MPFANNNGVALQNAGDTVTIILTNNSLAQDSQGIFTVAPAFVSGVSVPPGS